MLPQAHPPREREKEKKNEMNIPPPVDRLQNYLKFSSK